MKGNGDDLPCVVKASKSLGPCRWSTIGVQLPADSGDLDDGGESMAQSGGEVDVPGVEVLNGTGPSELRESILLGRESDHAHVAWEDKLTRGNK